MQIACLLNPGNEAQQWRPAKEGISVDDLQVLTRVHHFVQHAPQPHFVVAEGVERHVVRGWTSSLP